MLFGVPHGKDPIGAGAADPQGPVAVALRALRDEGLPLVLAADVCLCAYTSHGHCGVLDGDRVANDAVAATSRRRGPGVRGGWCRRRRAVSDDGRAGRGHPRGARRRSAEDDAILAYAAKHASSLYGPFRDAADSGPAFGDRRSYQLDPANGRDALRELALDAAEGADILMVKPALTNLDVLVRARQRFDLPLAAYQVSGEVAMLDAAAAAGHLDRRAATLEMLTAIARAGADIIVTYLAAEVAGWLDEARS